ncbi:MAG: ribosomal protein L23 [Gammaproteobacteria bacterium]|jgi:ribosomal protein L23
MSSSNKAVKESTYKVEDVSAANTGNSFNPGDNSTHHSDEQAFVSEKMLRLREKRNNLISENSTDSTKTLIKALVNDINIVEEENRRGVLQEKVVVNLTLLNSKREKEITKRTLYWTDEASLILENLDINKVYEIRQDYNDRDYLEWVDIQLVDLNQQDLI